MTRAKICGITNVEDALAAVQNGASYIGFVFAESPRRCDPATARHIRRIVGGDVKAVGVFTEESDEVLRVLDECELDYAQLHGYQSEEFAARIGAQRVIRAARVKSERSVAALAEFTEAAFYLLDAYKEGVAGGTGTTFDWSILSAAGDLGKPIFLSGGLNPHNVTHAIAAVHPFAVDVASGVEAAPGTKDHAKIKEFMDNVRKADNPA